MSYNPLYPEDGILIRAVEMRTQFQGLKALVDAVPAGPPGPAGPEGPAFSNVQIGGVTTVDSGTPAAASVSVFGNTVELSFSIPKGEPGSPGVTSEDVANALVNERINHAQNPTSVSTLSLTISDPPTKAEVEAVMGKVNELIAALQRQP